MAMALYEPVSVVVPLRLCSTPESMDEKSSESDVSRDNTPSRDDESSLKVPVLSDDKFHPDTKEVKPVSESTPTTSRDTSSSSSTVSHKRSPSSQHTSTQPKKTPLPVVSHNQRDSSMKQSQPASIQTTSSSSESSPPVVVCTSVPPVESQISISTTNHARASATPSRSSQPSPITSAAMGSGSRSAHPPTLLSQQNVDTAKANENNMLTLSSYVQFMTLQQQGQMSYPALVPSACLPQSVTNPPTTLPPQYDTNLSQSYSPSFPSSLQPFGYTAAANKFNGLIPQQLNQGLITLDMPVAAATTTTPQSKQGCVNLGLDHRFMVGGPLSGALPGHEVARAVGNVGVPLVIAGRSDVGVGAMGGSVESGSAYKRSRKRSYSQTNNDTQDVGDMQGYNVRRSIFPSEDQCGNQMSDTTIGGAPHSLCAGGGGGSQQQQQLKWQAHQVDTWHDLCDGALQDIPQIGFTVETDKGFVFSVADDTFVCQKKNHFQVTVTTVFHRTPKFIKIKGGSIQPVDKFLLRLHGVKLESVNTTIKLEQSMTDRRRSDFTPIDVQVPSNPAEPAKHTACRLHFGETTANNMRKRGKPNPDQKFFSLVVGLYAVCELGSFPVVAHVSERIIVRASNPGNFDNDCDYLWLKSPTPDSIYHHGRVGINTDKPDEALSVNGNIRVTGRIEHPSDMRIKTNISLVDSCKQLESVLQMQLYQYQYREGVMTEATSYEENRQQVGVLAQELRQILPDAVYETNTDVSLSDGSTVSKLLVIDKDRIMMETVGAVQELKKITDGITKRLDCIEKEFITQEKSAVKSTSLLSSGNSITNILLVVIIIMLWCFMLLY